MAATEKSKLKQLIESLGYSSEDEIPENTIMDSVVPGICMTPSCSFTSDVEPDQEQGYCEQCDAFTVKSLNILMGII
jgi:hypothetical protein